MCCVLDVCCTVAVLHFCGCRINVVLFIYYCLLHIPLVCGSNVYGLHRWMGLLTHCLLSVVYDTKYISSTVVVVYY
jgi:hypothetical protein